MCYSTGWLLALVCKKYRLVENYRFPQKGFSTEANFQSRGAKKKLWVVGGYLKIFALHMLKIFFQSSKAH